jgi:hypothetical protein
MIKLVYRLLILKYDKRRAPTPRHRLGSILLVSLSMLSGMFSHAEQSPITVSAIEYKAGDEAYVYSDKVNMRDGPATGATVMKMLMAGDRVQVIEKNALRQNLLYGIADYWYKVNSAGQEGYVWGGLLAKSLGLADLEGPGSQDRIIEQAFVSYQDSVPLQISKDYFDRNILPKFADPDKKKKVLRYYQAYRYGDGQTLNLMAFLSDGAVDDSPDIAYPKAQIQDVSALLRSGGVDDRDDGLGIYFRRYGVSGRIQLKMLTAKKAPWEFAYAFPRPSASSPAENLVGAYGIETPEAGSESRYGEGFNNPAAALLADKGFSPPVALLSFSVDATRDVSTYGQAALFFFDGKGLSLVTSYTTGWNGGGESGKTDLVFPSDGGGTKNVLAFKTYVIDSPKGVVKFRWDGSRFAKTP